MAQETVEMTHTLLKLAKVSIGTCKRYVHVLVDVLPILAFIQLGSNLVTIEGKIALCNSNERSINDGVLLLSTLIQQPNTTNQLTVSVPDTGEHKVECKLSNEWAWTI